MYFQTMIIRASVDALCRDGTSEISRDPLTKRLQTRRESLARPSKHTNNNLLDSYLAVHKPSSFLPASSLPRKNPLTRDFHNFRVIILIIIIIISKPAISLLEPAEAIIFSPNISSVDGGVHGREAIVLGSLCITMVGHGAPRRKGLHNAICSVSHDGLVICACAAGTRPSARARVAQYVREAQISFLIEKMSGTSGKIISLK